VVGREEPSGHTASRLNLAEPWHAGDGVQRPLRFRFPPRLMPSVDMTSDVKSREPLFLGLHAVFILRASEKPEPVISDGWACGYPWGGSHL